MLEIEVTPRALVQLKRAAMWWREHRVAAPNAVIEDFEAAANLLAIEPGIGIRTASSRYPHRKLVVLAFWGLREGVRFKVVGRLS